MKNDRKQTARAVRAASRNWITKGLSYVAPQAAANRLLGEYRLAQMEAWHRSQPGRMIHPRRNRLYRADWPARSSSADAAINPDLPDFHSLVNDLFLASPMAHGTLKQKVAHTVSTGLELRPSIDRQMLGLDDEQARVWELQALALWRQWIGSTGCDRARRHKFNELQRNLFAAYGQKGDVLAIVGRRRVPVNGFHLMIQTIEADRCSNPENEMDGTRKINGREDERTVLSGGVEYRDGAVSAFHFSRFAPGEYPGAGISRSADDWRRVVARRQVGEFERPNVLHLFDPFRVDQSRGIGDYQVVLEAIKQLTGYTEAESDAAFRAALDTVFITQEFGVEDMSGSGQASTGAAEPQKPFDQLKAGVVQLFPGEDVKVPTHGRPNDAFGPFIEALSVGICAATGVPKEVAMMHFQTSYTAAQAAANVFMALVRDDRALFVHNFCMPVYQAFLDEVVTDGRLPAPGYWSNPLVQAAWSGSRWVGPPRMVIREDIQVRAARERIDARLSSRQDEITGMSGRDYRAVQTELADEAQDVAGVVQEE